jgi:rubredoxin
MGRDPGYPGQGVGVLTAGELSSRFASREQWMSCHQCLECAYIYDPAKGDPTQKIPPGTPFEKLPPTWRCPECKISIQKRGVFRKLDD